MDISTKEEMEAYRGDKLKNASNFVIALKICQLLYTDCVTNKQVALVLEMVKEILGIPPEATPERYL